ncbi:MAG: glycosyltransferase family 4 protein [Nitritalea sp.]
MKKIVVINQSTGYLTIDVVNQFVKYFDQVDLVFGTMTEEKHPLDRTVRKTRVMQKTRKSNVGRFFRWGIASVQIQFLLWTKFRNHEVFYYSLPPFAYLGALLLKRKYSIMIFDVYPDVLKTIGILPSNPIYRFWAWANKKVFSKAHRVFTLNEGLKKLLEQYHNQIYVVDLWNTLSGIKTGSKCDNPFSKTHGFENKFIVQYSGNIGQTYNVDILIKLAHRMQNIQNLHFVIIGRGTKLPYLVNMIEEHKLVNVTVLPFQPPDMLQYSLTNADIGVVMLDDKAADMSLPSKTFNMMAAGNAILALAPKGSVLDLLIQKHNMGFCIPESHLDDIERTILYLYQNTDQLNNLRNNALYASNFYTEQNASKVTQIYFHDSKN